MEGHWVNVRIQGCDLDYGYLCGTMEALNVPLADTPVVTFWEGEIVDMKNDTFYTGKWEAIPENDIKHWSKFPAFSLLLSQVEADGGKSLDLSKTTPTYLCDGSINGFYYDPNSSPFQKLELKFTNEDRAGFTFSSYHFLFRDAGPEPAFHGLSEGPVLVDLTLVRDAQKKGAVCLDGSPPGYYLLPGFGSGADTWVVHLEVLIWEGFSILAAIVMISVHSCPSKPLLNVFETRAFSLMGMIFLGKGPCDHSTMMLSTFRILQKICQKTVSQRLNQLKLVAELIDKLCMLEVAIPGWQASFQVLDCACKQGIVLMREVVVGTGMLEAGAWRMRSEAMETEEMEVRFEIDGLN
ncbi:hypothetical protein J5N97_014911 [Dioscorea zingiberensis]|uniref:Pectin acetylesterase n=1 Tax=Dioscorea zingiberensis TaxID=325984 RepID=A0A9D5CVJ3_9LILI|nr:hypothetical protein J5N97_014911 [Dioscorea zingiberensis]